MKKLTADEFAAKVMATGTEIEYDNGVWMIYAHLTDDGDVKTSHLDARDLMVTTSIELSDEEGEALMNGNLDDVERQAVVEVFTRSILKLWKIWSKEKSPADVRTPTRGL